jgi:hypothetical protein
VTAQVIKKQVKISKTVAKFWLSSCYLNFKLQVYGYYIIFYRATFQHALTELLHLPVFCNVANLV